MGTMTIESLLEMAGVVRHMNGLDTSKTGDIRLAMALAMAWKNMTPFMEAYNESLGALPEDMEPSERQAQVRELQAQEIDISLPKIKLSWLQKCTVSSSATPPHKEFIPIPGGFLVTLMPMIVDDLGEQDDNI